MLEPAAHGVNTIKSMRRVSPEPLRSAKALSNTGGPGSPRRQPPWGGGGGVPATRIVVSGPTPVNREDMRTPYEVGRLIAAKARTARLRGSARGVRGPRKRPSRGLGQSPI